MLSTNSKDHGKQGARGWAEEWGWRWIKKTLPNEEETVKTASIVHLRAGETAQGKAFLTLGATFNGTTC